MSNQQDPILEFYKQQIVNMEETRERMNRTRTAMYTATILNIIAMMANIAAILIKLLQQG